MAFRFSVRAAFGGDSEAQYNVSWCYHYGRGTDKNPDKAFFYSSLSAEQGHVDGLYLFGGILSRGYGCKVDLMKSFDCYSKAAEMGCTFFSNSQINFHHHSQSKHVKLGRRTNRGKRRLGKTAYSNRFI
jgi:TPR repeat protein